MHGVWRLSGFLFSQNVVPYGMGCFFGNADAILRDVCLSIQWWLTCTVVGCIARGGVICGGRLGLVDPTLLAQSPSSRTVSLHVIAHGPIPSATPASLNPFDVHPSFTLFEKDGVGWRSSTLSVFS